MLAGSNVITVIALSTCVIPDVSVVVKVTHAGMLSLGFSAFLLPQNRHYAHMSREGALGSFERKLPTGRAFTQEKQNVAKFIIDITGS